jgi:hypothetical protein
MTSMSDSGTCACRAKPEILQLLFQTTIKTIRKLYKAIIPLVYKIYYDAHGKSRDEQGSTHQQ